jgi:hypothetical protein
MGFMAVRSVWLTALGSRRKRADWSGRRLPEQFLLSALGVWNLGEMWAEEPAALSAENIPADDCSWLRRLACSGFAVGEEKTYAPCNWQLRFSGQKWGYLGVRMPIFEVKTAFLGEKRVKKTDLCLLVSYYYKNLSI